MTTTTQHQTWLEANQRYLTAAMGIVRGMLDRHTTGPEDTLQKDEPIRAAEADLPEIAASMPAPPAVEMFCASFGLSPFERDILLLCAGMELDSSFAGHCAAVRSDTRRAYPTFSLAMAVLPEAHWSALTPASPLRRWRLIEVGVGESVTLSPLRIDETVLHYLTGIPYLDERLQGFLEVVPPSAELAPSQRVVSDRLKGLWSQTVSNTAWPVIQLCGEESAGTRKIVAEACAALRLRLHVMRARDLPSPLAERDALARLWERQAILSNSALLLDCEEVDGPDTTRTVLSFIERLRGLLVLTGREPLNIRHRPAVRLDVKPPSAGEQQTLWRRVLGPVAQRLNGQVEAVVAQFRLGPQHVLAVGEAVARSLSPEVNSDEANVLWEACRVQARTRLDGLAQRIEGTVTWEDLVLPELQCQTLREIAMHVRQRAKVYELWGFAEKSARGLGITVLFGGASGTGKTMAAEVLANELRLDLHRIDLSQVVSKYIGETEKNLRRVFDAAEEGGAVLLFDEADALFGKRSEVKDSHDRYANIEVSYLLQRMESYRGLAILTTNMKSALDAAFLRRIRFIVQFPFPDAAQRAEIWRRIFPTKTPTKDLDVNRLAQLNVAGGNIRNIAMNAAFLAAHTGEPVRMTHLLQAARSEYAKLEKPLAEAESRGWV
jgi:ATP-dependent 26S proteasome regulatory subunit